MRASTLLVILSVVLLACTSISPLGFQGGIAQASWPTTPTPASVSNNDADLELFTPTASAGAIPQLQAGLVRSQFVRVNFSHLRRAQAVAGASAFADVLILNVFDNVRLEATRRAVDVASADRFTWLGTVAQSPQSEVTIVVDQNVMAADIALANTFYQVRYAGDEVYAISQLNPSRVGPHTNPIQPGGELAPVQKSAHSTAAAPTPAAAFDDGSAVTAMVLYTRRAQAAAGGKRQIEALINLAIAETNTAYARSGVRTRLQLVYMGQIEYQESHDIDVDLRSIREGDTVRALRDTYMADLVGLIVAFGGCGVGYLNSNSPYGEGYAFSVVTYDCTTGPTYGLAHEFGHNMGLAHDRKNAGGPGAFPYAYGYQEPTGEFADIMGYPCQGVGAGCPHIPNFSNPAVLYNGHPTGVDYQATDSADNTRALNNIAYTVANWRSGDHALPEGRIVSPSNGATVRSPLFSIAADARDNPGGSGVYNVVFWAYYNQGWHQLCVDTEAPFVCAWVARDVPDQQIMFAIHITDFGANETVDAGGYQEVSLKNTVALHNIFLPAAVR